MQKIILILSIIIFSFKVAYSQTLTQEEKDSTIAALRFNSPSIIHRVTNVLIENKIYEAIPEIKNKIWEKDIDTQIYFLIALVNLNSENASEYVNNYLDILKNYQPVPSSNIDTFDLKIRAIEQLFFLEDYTYAYYIFDKIYDTTHTNHLNIIDMLFWLIQHSPENEEKAKNELMYAIKNADNKTIRSRALNLFETKYVSTNELLQLYIERFKEDEDFGIRLTILTSKFPKYDNNLVKEVIRERLYFEPEAIIRRQIAKYILDSLGTPKDYKYILDWLTDKNTDIEVKNEIKFDLDYNIFPFQPRYSISKNTVSTVLDTLTSYTNQCYSYEWLKDETYKNELLTKLTNAKNYLSSGDSINCRTEVAAFQNSVNQVYQDSAGSYPKYVSDEAYKFLYYYSGYIIERL